MMCTAIPGHLKLFCPRAGLEALGENHILSFILFVSVNQGTNSLFKDNCHGVVTKLRLIMAEHQKHEIIS